MFAEKSLLEFLKKNAITYEYYAHPAVFTNETADVFTGDLPGFHAKNLFLTDEKKRRFYLVVCAGDRKINLKDLGDRLQEKRMKFASAETMQQLLGITPGSVTPLGVINDVENKVQLVFEKEAWEADSVHCHPLVNTATLILAHDALERFFQLTQHSVKILEL